MLTHYCGTCRHMQKVERVDRIVWLCPFKVFLVWPIKPACDLFEALEESS